MFDKKYKNTHVTIKAENPKSGVYKKMMLFLFEVKAEVEKLFEVNFFVYFTKTNQTFHLNMNGRLFNTIINSRDRPMGYVG